MSRFLCNWIVLAAVLLAPAASFAQVACTRDGLQAATNLYLEAQTKGDTSGLPLATGLAYIENMQVVDIKSGVIQKPLKIDFHRTLIDPATCQTFTEVIVTDKAHPYVLGTRLRVNHDKIAEIESMVTQQGDWLFNADNYYKWSPSEDWGVIPPDQRDTRDTLVAAANAYLDAFLEKKLDLVPWGEPCNRTEGGIRTGKGLPTIAARSACRPASTSWRGASSSTRRLERLSRSAISVSADCRIPTSFAWNTASCVTSIR